ncbi:hypothetical protein Droror1_Dr00019383 [Drosera rotundifolia]
MCEWPKFLESAIPFLLEPTHKEAQPNWFMLLALSKKKKKKLLRLRDAQPTSPNTSSRDQEDPLSLSITIWKLHLITTAEFPFEPLLFILNRACFPESPRRVTE